MTRFDRLQNLRGRLLKSGQYLQAENGQVGHLAAWISVDCTINGFTDECSARIEKNAGKLK